MTLRGSAFCVPLALLLLAASCTSGGGAPATATPAAGSGPTAPAASTTAETAPTPVVVEPGESECVALSPPHEPPMPVAIGGDPFCVAWESPSSRMDGFLVTISFSPSGETFSYRLGPGARSLALPPESRPRSATDGLSECLPRQSYQVNVFGISDGATRPIGSRAVSIECAPRVIASTTRLRA